MSKLADRTKHELYEMAKKRGLFGIARLSKEELLEALNGMGPRAKPTTVPLRKERPPADSAPAPAAKSAAKLTSKPKASPPKPIVGVPVRPALNVPIRSVPGKPPVTARIEAPKPAAAKSPLPLGKAPPAKLLPKPVVPVVKIIPPITPEKDISAKTSAKGGAVKDQIWLMVSDPFWLHAYWELSMQSVQRAEAAFGQDWHTAKPVIRLFDVTSLDTTATSETPVRDLFIQAGCNHWYIDVPQPPKSYRVDIGFVSRRGDFRPLARSNVVTPPKAGASESMPENWANDLEDTAAERILAMSTGFESAGGPPQLRELFDEQFRRSGKEAAYGSGAVLPDKLKKFGFEMHTELIVHGRTDPTAHVTMQNEPVKLRNDGTFTMRYALTDGRQIIPAVATAADGMEERTIVLAIERNIKHLDPMVHDLFSET